MPKISELIGLTPVGPTVFEVDDIVTGKTRPDDYDFRPELAGRQFRVTAVEETPCTCGSHSDPDAYHVGGCRLADVGHPQWVTIVVDGRESVYSGIFLEKA